MNKSLTKLSHKLKYILQFLLRNKTNFPYLSGDCFRSLADMTIDSTTPLNNIDIKKLTKSKIIFVESHKFLGIKKDIWNKIENPYVIIIGNSDVNIDSTPKVSTLCQAVYCQNPGFLCNGKFRFLPIGLENLRLIGSGFKKYFKNGKDSKIVSKVLITPMSPTNEIRAEIIDFAKRNKDIFELEKSRLSRKLYFKLLESYKFVLAPEGNGYDTHRLWEILYKGSIPLVKRTKWSQNLEKLELPIFFYSRIEEIDLRELRRFGELNDFKPTDLKILWMNHWKEEINELLRP